MHHASNEIYVILLIGLLVLGCKEKTADKKVGVGKIEFNQDLADELKKQAEID